MARALVLVTLLLGSILLAGCVDGPEEADLDVPVAPTCAADGFCGADPILDETGRDLRTQLTAEDQLPAPVWQVGDIFEQHLYNGNRDTTGEHIKTMVVDDSGGCYQMGTTSANAAKVDASFDIPVLGCIGKTHLETSAFGIPWAWMYDFPLSDGKSWSGGIDQMVNWNSNTLHSFTFTLTASYKPAINTPEGDFPGFEIVGVTDDGTTLLDYNYVPAIGWFSHFWFYDVTNDIPDGRDDIMFHAMSMGTSTGYSGPYYLDEAVTLVEELYIPPVSGNAPQSVFTVPADATYLMGVIVPMACPGASAMVVVPPTGSPEPYEHQYDGDPAACQEADESTPGLFSVYYVDRPAVAGDWHYGTAGVGIFGHFLWIDAVTEVEYELAPAPAVVAETP